MSPRSYTTVSEKSFQHRQGELGHTVDINKTEDGITINGVPLLGSTLDEFCHWLDPTTKEVCAELEATDELVEELGLAAKKLELRAKDAEDRVRALDEQLRDRVEELEQLQDRVEELEQLLDTSEANVKDWKEAWQAVMTELTSFALQEENPICQFYETVRIDVHEGAFSHPAVDAMTLLGVKDAKRFEKHCCRMTFEALFPIGPPADVSKPEGRDS